MTYHDIRSIKSFEDQTVIAIKAPPETKLEVPDPREVSCFISLYMSACSGLNGQITTAVLLVI